MEAEEYKNKAVNDIDKSTYSQEQKNKLPYFNGNDLETAYECGFSEAAKKAERSYCIVSGCEYLNDCTLHMEYCPEIEKFKSLIK
jgi:hypothetical protein